MSGLNKVLLIGNLGKEPDFKHYEGGHLRASFPLATTEYYKNREGRKQEQTEWHSIIAWRGLAESLQNLQLKKGTMLYVEGKIRNRNYDSREGNKKFLVEIVAEIVTVLKRPMGDYTYMSNNANTVPAPADHPATDTGTLPF